MQAEKQKYQNWSRLKKRSEFLWAGQSGLKWVSPSVIIQMSLKDTGKQGAAKDMPAFRFGVTATKKLGHAPIRNRIKRRLRAALKDVIAENQTLTETLSPVDIVLIGRDKTANIAYEQLKKDMRWCLKRLAQKAGEAKAK